MNTLTTLHNLTWGIGSYGGKAAFLYASLDLSVTFHPSVGEYTFWCGMVEVFSDKSASVCLEVAEETLLDYYASQFIPSWEEEECPDTLRSHTMCDQAAE